MAQLILNGLPRELLWKLTHGWPPPTLPADNLEDPAEHLLSIGLAEVVDGGLWATQAGYDLRARIEREELCASGRHWRPPSRAAGIKRARAQRMSCAMSPTERK